MIKLRPLIREDLPQRVELLNNVAIAPYINTNEKFQIDKTVIWFEKSHNSDSRKDFSFLHNDVIVGMGGLTNISENDKNCELYMYMHPDFQGKGYGFYSCIALCDFAFDKLNMKKVFLYTFTDNTKANSLYEKVGFKLEGTLRKHTLKDGKLKDRHIFGIFKEEFTKL